MAGMSRRILPMADFHKRLSMLVEKYSAGNSADFARKIGVNTATFHNYVAKGRLPNAETLFAIKKHLNVDMNWLIGGQGDMTAGVEPLDEIALTRSISAVEKFLDETGKTLPPRKKAQLVSLIYGKTIKKDAEDTLDALKKFAEIIW
jgi:transcriptional regulator with XRE-family HTH domain